MCLTLKLCFIKIMHNLICCSKVRLLKARIHCEIFLSVYFMKHSLMHISLHLIWFHEIHIWHLKRKPLRTIIITKNEFKRVFNLLLYIFSKKTGKQKKNKDKGEYGLIPRWKIVCIQVPSIIYLRRWWLMRKRNFEDFSEFLCFMKGCKKYITNISR